jgi:hypothetical protein
MESAHIKKIDAWRCRRFEMAAMKIHRCLRGEPSVKGRANATCALRRTAGAGQDGSPDAVDERSIAHEFLGPVRMGTAENNSPSGLPG